MADQKKAYCPPDRLLNVSELTGLLGCCRRSVYNFIDKPDFPAPSPLYIAFRHWLKSDIERYAGITTDKPEGSQTLLNATKLSQILGCSKSTLYRRFINLPGFPAPLPQKLMARRRWVERDVIAFIQNPPKEAIDALALLEVA